MNEIIKHAQRNLSCNERSIPFSRESISSGNPCPEKHDDIHYIGMKKCGPNTLRLIQRLKAHGYIPHTVDRCSINGRAVDAVKESQHYRKKDDRFQQMGAGRQSMYFWESMIWESERMEAGSVLLRQ